MAQVILKHIASGDKTAVQKCIDTYGGLVWSLALRMLSNSDEAEDAVQEIFIDVWKNAGRFDETQASETTFIAMIARRRLIDRIRKQNRQPGIDSFEDVSAEHPENTSFNIQTSIEAKEAAQAMKNLRPEQRQILHLSIVQGFSHQEISSALDIPLGTVKTHARRGLIKIREVLGLENSEDTKEATV
ncbi:MAG: sigma-70 family RNA polymerase sigma factor [Acidobacteria bacterium]|nr:sigma-70 family RNA polymerase sigma factor [Acidobacteriota bacterium]MCA1639673.1 sigma-70 family RNA polymerase sigma factor [Acidobacteriota bacterium]